jgi:hypothetical protein
MFGINPGGVWCVTVEAAADSGGRSGKAELVGASRAARNRGKWRIAGSAVSPTGTPADTDGEQMDARVGPGTLVRDPAFRRQRG